MSAHNLQAATGGPRYWTAIGLVLLLAAPAFTQSLRIPDFREVRAEPVAGPRPGESCDGCGVIISIREIRKQSPIPVPKQLQSDVGDRGPGYDMPIGAVIALPGGDTGAGTPYVGGVGTPEMRERFTQSSYQVAVRLDNGAQTALERRDGTRFRVGDRVRVRGIQMELLTP